MIIQQQYPFRGLKKITIPIKESDLSLVEIKKYLPKVLPIHFENAAKIKTCYNRYLAGHEILKKTRLYEEDSENNNIVIEPHLFSIVEFKKGYIFGQGKEYAQTEAKNTDDIGYLNKYSREQCSAAKDAEEAQYIYACGVGYQFIRPKKYTVDVSKESPYETIVIHPAECFKVYSSHIGQDALFDVMLVNLEEPSPDIGGTATSKTIACVYTKREYIEFEILSLVGFSVRPIITSWKQKAWHVLPLRRKSWHPDMVGVVELGDSLQQAIDTLSSGSIDAFVDNANALLAFINAKIPGGTPEERAKNFRLMLKSGVVELISTDINRPADLKEVAVRIDYSDTQTKYDSLIRTLYNAMGVPLASGTNSSGGDTGQARALGNGWENAYTVASKDVQELVRGDRELLRKQLEISSLHSNCKLNELSLGDIEIKYPLSRSDNLQVKTQSLQTLMAPPVNMPAKIALQVCGLVSDPNAVAEAMEKYAQELQAKAALNNVGDDLKAQSNQKQAEKPA